MAWQEVEGATYASSGSTIRCEQGALLTPDGNFAVTVTDSFHQIAAGTLTTIHGGVANSLYLFQATGSLNISSSTNFTTQTTTLSANDLWVLWFDGTAFTDVTELAVTRTGAQTIAGNKTFTSGLFERGRTAAAGVWTTFTPTVAASAGTFTNPTYTTMKYMLLGKTMFLSCAFNGTLSTNALMTLTIPASAVAAVKADFLGRDVTAGATAPMLIGVNASATTMTLYHDCSGANFGSGAVSVTFNLALEIQ